MELASVNSHRAPPATRGDADPNAPAALRVAGQRTPNPQVLIELDFLDSEDSLRKALHGGDTLFVEAFPQTEEDKVGRQANHVNSQSNDPKFTQTMALIEVMNMEPSLQFLTKAPPRFSSFVRARVLQSIRGHSLNVVGNIQAPLECACTLGLPSLREEAMKCLGNPDRVGAKLNHGNLCNGVSFGRPMMLNFWTVTPMCINDLECTLYDFGDTIPLLHNDEIFDRYGKSLIGKIKCLLIHMDASLLSIRSDRVVGNGISSVTKSEANRLSSELRLDQHKQVSKCNEVVCDPAGNDSITVCELRSHAHDIIFPNLDRGYKSLICFPPDRMKGINIFSN